MNKYTERLYNGIWKENPIFVQMLGLCPTLAVTTSAMNGLGMKAKEPDFKDQFNGMKAQKLEVTKTDATADNQVQAISGATYTSKAVTGATNAAIYFVENCVGK